MASEWAAAARLVRRTGFGATGSDIDAAAQEGAASYVTRMLAADPAKDPGALRTPPPSFDRVAPTGKDPSQEQKKAKHQALHEQAKTLTGWWLRRMLAVDAPFAEKATFAWHAHFATSLKKVKFSALMLAQNERLRQLATSDFSTLAYAMLTDAATLRWLDGEKNTVQGPNENLSREFMEIYTLGHADGYTENDVRQAARALTGLKINPRDGSSSLRPGQHDNGTKTIFGRSADYDPKSFCAAVLDRPGCADYVVTRMWHQFVSNDAPSAETLRRLVAAYGPRRDLTALLRTMFTDASFAAAEGSFIIGPVEWLIGSMRILGVDADQDAVLMQAAAGLDSLGQLPFFPPSVGGWPTGRVWLSSAAADIRFHLASRLVPRAQLSSITGSTSAKIDALAHLLGVTTWSARTLAVLKGSAADPHKLVVVALNTPEYLVH